MNLQVLAGHGCVISRNLKMWTPFVDGAHCPGQAFCKSLEPGAREFVLASSLNFRDNPSGAPVWAWAEA